MIPAETHDDNRKHEVQFDATKWFEQASDEAILGVVACDFGGDYAADEVAEFFDGKNDQVSEMFEKKDCGFECHVNPAGALKWIMENRPALYNKIKSEELSGFIE